MTGCECCGNDEASYQVCPDCLADPCAHGAEVREDVFLVAFGVTGADSRDEAQRKLMSELKSRLRMSVANESGAYIEEWWIAEDDRLDGSDNESAVFVPYAKGAGAVAR